MKIYKYVVRPAAAAPALVHHHESTVFYDGFPTVECLGRRLSLIAQVTVELGEYRDFGWRRREERGK